MYPGLRPVAGSRDAGGLGLRIACGERGYERKRQRDAGGGALEEVSARNSLLALTFHFLLPTVQRSLHACAIQKTNETWLSGDERRE
jgi:hypothetical protein